MSFIDKARKYAREHPDQVGKIVDKAGDLFDRRTGGKYAAQTDKAQDMARDRLADGHVPADGEQVPTDGRQPPA